MTGIPDDTYAFVNLTAIPHQRRIPDAKGIRRSSKGYVVGAYNVLLAAVMKGRGMRHLTGLPVALAVFAAMALFPRPSISASGPDLTVAFQGNNQLAGGQDALFLVQNIGDRPVNVSTVALIELTNSGTVTPLNVIVPPLLPGRFQQIKMTLPPNCAFAKIRAIVDINNVVQELSETNNTTGYIYICQPQPPGHTTNPVPPTFNPPPVPHPVTKTMTLTPSNLIGVVKQLSRIPWWCRETIGTQLPPEQPLWVGYESLNNCEFLSDTYQTAVKFNLDAIHQHADVVITRADLIYDEQVLKARIGDGSATSYTSCGNALGLANIDWTPNYNGLIPNDNTDVGNDSAARHWDVTAVVEHWYIYGGNNGFVIRGDNESFPENNAACVSLLSNFRLNVTFVGH